MPMTHHERAVRRKQIAALVKKGKTPQEAARAFGVGIATVRSACKEHGVIAETASSRDERREKRRLAAEIIATGGSISEACSATAMSANTVYAACIEFGVIDKDSREVQRQKRQKAAQQVAKGISVNKVCQAYQLSFAAVRDACKEFGVEPPDRQISFQRKMFALAALMGTDKTIRQIAKEQKMDEVSVTHIYRQARKAGIPIAVRKPGSRKRA